MAESLAESINAAFEVATIEFVMIEKAEHEMKKEAEKKDDLDVSVSDSVA